MTSCLLLLNRYYYHTIRAVTNRTGHFNINLLASTIKIWKYCNITHSDTKSHSQKSSIKRNLAYNIICLSSRFIQLSTHLNPTYFSPLPIISLTTPSIHSPQDITIVTHPSLFILRHPIFTSHSSTQDEEKTSPVTEAHVM